MNNIQIINKETGKIIGFISDPIHIEMEYDEQSEKVITSTGTVSGQMKVEQIDASMIVGEVRDPDVKKPNAKEALRDFLETKRRRPNTKKRNKKRKR